jgi:hypothetical protein
VYIKKNISKNDTIVICWSTPLREDRWFENSGWMGLGNIYNQNFYNQEWIEKYFDPVMGCIETINYVNAAQLILDQTGCKWRMIWMDLLDNGVHRENSSIKNLIEISDPMLKLSNYLNKCYNHPNMINVSLENFKKEISEQLNLNLKVINYSKFYNEKFVDEHPNPVVGYYFVKNILFPNLNLDNFGSEILLELANEWMEYLKDYPRKISEPKFLISGVSKYSTIPKVIW